MPLAYVDTSALRAALDRTLQETIAAIAAVEAAEQRANADRAPTIEANTIPLDPAPVAPDIAGAVAAHIEATDAMARVPDTGGEPPADTDAKPDTKAKSK